MKVDFYLCHFLIPPAKIIRQNNFNKLGIDRETIFEYDINFCEHIKPKFLFNIPDYQEPDYHSIRNDILSKYNYDLFQTFDGYSTTLSTTGEKIEISSTRPFAHFEYTFATSNDMHLFNLSNPDFFAMKSDFSDYPFFLNPTSKDFYIVDKATALSFSASSEFFLLFNNGEYCFDLSNIVLASQYVNLPSEYKHHIIDKFKQAESALLCLWNH